MPSDLSYYAFGDDSIGEKLATYAREHPRKVRKVFAQLSGYGATQTAAELRATLLDFLQRYPPSLWTEYPEDQQAYFGLHRAALESAIANVEGDASARALAAVRLQAAQVIAGTTTDRLAVSDAAPSALDNILNTVGTAGRTVAIGAALLAGYVLFTQLRRK